jgi:hypothetical protein
MHMTETPAGRAGTHVPETCRFCEAAGLTHDDWQVVYLAAVSTPSDDRQVL